MNKLKTNWITDGLIDFEYKKYLLLAYLQEVEASFDEARLYPVLTELASHFNHLHVLKRKKKETEDAFPKSMSKIDLKKMRIEYQKMLDSNEQLKEIEQIIEFAIPKLHRAIDNGKELYDFIEQNMQVFPVGLMPIQANEGYVLLRSGDNSPTHVYEFQITLIQNAKDKYRGIKTHFVEQIPKKISNTFQSIKVDLLRNRSEIINPATFAVESRLSFPAQESVLPIAKRILMKYLSNYAA